MTSRSQAKVRIGGTGIGQVLNRHPLMACSAGEMVNFRFSGTYFNIIFDLGYFYFSPYSISIIPHMTENEDVTALSRHLPT